VDSTGCGLPASLKDLFPGAGGSAAKAGAKRQTVWDYTRSGFDHLALTAWNIPENKDVYVVVLLVQKGIMFLYDVGSFTVQALAHIAATGAYFLSRLNHQTNIYETVAGHVTPLELAPFLPSVEGNIVEKDIFIGAKDQVGVRLIASRVPEMRVHERRGKARKNAKKKGYTPSHAHLTLFAWNLVMTNVPQTIWKTETVIKVYPLRWPIEML
jgi:hypothetical protein